MSKELAKTYDPKDMEERIYKKWEDNGYFHAEVDRSKKPFTIVMPPPNITGQLHMGHALDNTMQDILIRYKKMKGFNTLWQPGVDHAAIATEVKVIEHLKSQGINKDDLGRDGFLEKCWDWKEEYGGRIVNQLKKIGSAADWDRQRFTMDEGCSKAVEEVFIDFYKKGYIYRGEKIINYCPVCQTTISDAEVEHEEQAGHFWHMRYEIVGEPGRYVEFATTRPETMLGDTAVAVNPEDERYQDIIGKTVMLPFMNREIPVLADEYVDMEFGTGVVKITPAHDPNDFEVGKRHNLEVINVLNDDATINENGGEFCGMDRYEARKGIVKKMDEMGLLVKIEDHTHNVGTHDRCGTVVEPMVKPQWFVAMQELAKPAIDAIKKEELKFVPRNYDKTYLHWLTNIRDWCISRQLWWGHRIPAYYCEECGEIVVARADEVPDKCPKCGCTHLKQDEDTLDTWFSSALWPFSTLGWPEKTEEMDYFYPTDVLVTGYDIIFFWVVRMVFSGYAHTGKSPFDTVLIHGLVRDSQGRKMSKSLGNGIDPLEVIDEYGADALRLTLMTGNAPGNDMRFSDERMQNSRNFANKIWNASRFIMMNLEGETIEKPNESDLVNADKWILSEFNSLVDEVTYNMDKFELGIAVSKIYDFIWDEFCDYYIEFVKPRIYNKDDESRHVGAAFWTLKTVLSQSLILLHPFMPFITEEIYCNLLPEEESIMLADWPEYKEEWNFTDAEEKIGRAKDLIKGIRNVRAEMDVPHNKKPHIFITSESEHVRNVFTEIQNTYKSLGGINSVTVQQGEEGIPDGSVSFVIPDAVIFVPFEEIIDIEKEKERLSKEINKLKGELKRSKGMLSNEKFLNKAPKEKVQEEKDKLKKYEQMMEDVVKRFEALK
ncbi:MAG: valine--tRNA ligase [Lachnospiraceae bacterium]|nr:valine--tRNA ligase [Lachnospiraceae bacterium]